MENTDFSRRVGFIRVSDPFWHEHSDKIRQNLSDGTILNVVQSLSPRGYLQSKDIILSHPEFSELGHGEIIPRYICEFFPNHDGSVTRGPIVTDGLV